jgi:RecB family endonuclease NucS/predicted transport protein
MPVFQIKNNKAQQVFLDTNHFNNEAELRDFFADNLEELLGVRFLAKEYPTTDGGRIDTLAIDETNSPVIIEYKWGQDNAIFVQGLFYFDWLKKNKRDFEYLVVDKLGKQDKVNWTSPRVILIAQGFDNRTISAVQQVTNVELVKYMPYKQDILYLENVNVSNKAKKNTEEKQAVASGEEEVFDINYHLNKKQSIPEIKEVFAKLQEKIQSLPDVEEIANQKTGITYKTTMSFARFEFGRTYIDVLLRDPQYDDPQSLVQNISCYKWGYGGRAKIKSIEQVEAIFALISQSYQSTL